MHKLGVIGVPSDWLISCSVDEKLLKEKFDIELIHIKTQELEENYHSINEFVVPDEYLMKDFNKEEIKIAYKIYLAIEKIVEKYQLEGFTIRCFDLLSSLHSTSCLALAIFNSKGIIGTCEGDLPALISMFLVKKILNEPSFQANPSLILKDKNEMILAHCTLPLSMCASYKFDTHFESKIGIGIKGELKEEEIAIFRIGADLDKYVLLEGKITKNYSKDNLCRTQILVKLKDDVSYFLKNPLGNHHLIIYQSDFNKLKEYLNSKGLIQVH